MYTDWLLGLVSSVLQWPRRSEFNSRFSHTKDSKSWYLTPLCLTLNLIRYISRNMYTDWLLGLVSRVFSNGPGDQGSILGLVIPKTQKAGT